MLQNKELLLNKNQHNKIMLNLTKILTLNKSIFPVIIILFMCLQILKIIAINLLIILEIPLIFPIIKITPIPLNQIIQIITIIIMANNILKLATILNIFIIAKYTLIKLIRLIKLIKLIKLNQQNFRMLNKLLKVNNNKKMIKQKSFIKPITLFNPLLISVLKNFLETFRNKLNKIRKKKTYHFNYKIKIYFVIF
jgi:hypothetical protein